MTQLSGQPLAEARMALGMVFQHPHLVKRRSVVANVMTGTLGRHRNWMTALGFLPQSERPLAMHCLEEVGLASFAEQRAGTLSGGQAQRVSVARALAQRPLAVLADEPVASLDPEASEELMGLLGASLMRTASACFAFSTSRISLAAIADRILGMKGGRVQFDQKPADVQEVAVSALYTKDTQAVPETVPA